MEAQRISERLEMHYTPKPLATRLDRVDGSRLNMAELELGALARQCPDRRIPCQEMLKQETQAWWSKRSLETSGWTGSSPPGTLGSN